MTPNMPSSGRVDVRAVLDRYLKEVLPGKLWDGANRYCNQLGFADSEYSRDMAKLVEARAAVAELIEADKELQFIRNNGCAAETYDKAVARHDAALARCSGGES